MRSRGRCAASQMCHEVCCAQQESRRCSPSWSLVVPPEKSVPGNEQSWWLPSAGRTDTEQDEQARGRARGVGTDGAR